MEIQTPHFQQNLNKKCKDIWMEHLSPVVMELSEISKFYMSSQCGDSETIKINGAICDMLKFNNRYRELPLHLVAEAFQKGALGGLGGTTRYTVRNVCIWLNETCDKMERIEQYKISKIDDEKRKEEEKTYKQGQKYHSRFGAALRRKMEWAQSGMIDEQAWERITLDKLVDYMDKGYPIDQMTPGEIV